MTRLSLLPALYASHAGLWLCEPDGEARAVSRGEAVSAASETPVLLLNAPLTGQRLGYDALSGLDPSVRVRASSVLLDNPDLRASMAVDGDLRTGWVPSGIVGSWWEISGKARMIERVAITQRRVPQAGVDAGRIADRVRIEVDGRVVATARLTAGVNPIRLRKPLRGKVVRVEFTRESARETILSSKAIQLTCLGVADNYQSCETIQNYLVDPDNRRPVEYAARRSVRTSRASPMGRAFFSVATSRARLGGGFASPTPFDFPLTV